MSVMSSGVGLITINTGNPRKPYSLSPQATSTTVIITIIIITINDHHYDHWPSSSSSSTMIMITTDHHLYNNSHSDLHHYYLLSLPWATIINTQHQLFTTSVQASFATIIWKPVTTCTYCHSLLHGAYLCSSCKSPIFILLICWS